MIKKKTFSSDAVTAEKHLASLVFTYSLEMVLMQLCVLLQRAECNGKRRERPLCTAEYEYISGSSFQKNKTDVSLVLDWPLS